MSVYSCLYLFSIHSFIYFYLFSLIWTASRPQDGGLQLHASRFLRL